jgi:predicted nucleotidyltransferase
MVRARDIEAVVDQIAREFSPESVILFGSYAYGSPTEDSDVDILVVRRHRGPEHHAASRIRHAIDAPFAMDLLVRSPAEIKRRLAWGDYFVIDIMEQ